MSNYQLYYPTDLEFVKENGKPVTFDEAWKAAEYGREHADKHHTINPYITRDSMHEKMKQAIQSKYGEVLLAKDGPEIKNQEQHKISDKHYAIVKTDDNRYKPLEISESKDKRGINIKMNDSFSKPMDAHDSMDRMLKMERKRMEQERTPSLSIETKQEVHQSIER